MGARMRSAFAWIATLTGVACSSTPSMEGGNDAGWDYGEGVPTGTCSLTLAGAIVGPRVGVAYADMNGNGNLRVFCGSFPESSAEQLELAIGNGTYDGARKYDIDPSNSDGNVSFMTTSSVDYMPTSLSATCLVNLTTAPPGNFADTGSMVAGSFNCQGLTSGFDPKGQALALSLGQFNAPVR